MKEFWNERFASQTIDYDIEPNRFFKRFINTTKPGSILLPAESDGRNAIYAASKGWQVDAFGSSELIKAKVLQEAAERGVQINYEVLDLKKFKAVKQYDAVGLFYVNLPERIRMGFHKEICKCLKSGGILVLEAFAKDQLNFATGGPKDNAILYDAPGICNDFQHLYLLHIREKETVINEGAFYQGRGAVLRFVGQKL
ncbi:hypothetical protein OCK74_16585 [Chitinophagaceae bacterium LB-8]|uniref:SAM-dependent methyltransferase n=1 Tax=Paraflavisolibacter caeni TaxID=2982496 RepID=A0A9X2XXY2_9BACT|nr:hypothetical protein [Paraflavisolibacter caeni]MCU7550737.1 hypothetical protein [Paraflavisolibacter caeni]